jgi:hypothetical protein
MVADRRRASILSATAAVTVVPPSVASSAAIDAIIARKQAAVDAQVSLFAASMPTFLSSTAVQPPLSGHHIFFVEHEVPVVECDVTGGPATEVATSAAGASRGAALNAGFLLATEAASRQKCGLLDELSQRGFSAYCFRNMALLPQAGRAAVAQSAGEATPSDTEAGPWYAANPAYGPLHVGGFWERESTGSQGLDGAVTLTAEAVLACNGFPNVTGSTGATTELLARLQLAGLAGTVQRPSAQAPAAEAHSQTDVEAGGARSQSSPVIADSTADQQDGVASCRFTVVEARQLSGSATVLRTQLLPAGARSTHGEPIAWAVAEAVPLELIAPAAAPAVGAASTSTPAADIGATQQVANLNADSVAARAAEASASAEDVALDLTTRSPAPSRLPYH